ncbi:VOC family protein [Vibrio sp. SCSIO 43136]|uniref:VOC family protein n=1 Tax=Vibrio sp. SCSIO 43136 TaxID=2819101 RepID=UPI002075BE29|nr:VOC family protein [Vibrio sp. SCSIO 43136]USD67268.1 VOC family protein [Vibrio sp. SCSIO 43136]
MKAYIEHANITVEDPKHTIALLLAAAPEWRIRGQGIYEDDGIEWYHVGDQDTYITIQGGGSGQLQEWNVPWVGVKHIGIAVPDLSKTVESLAESGFELDHWGGSTEHRRSVYYVDKHNIQFEFVEYRSEDPKLRNQYV